MMDKKAYHAANESSLGVKLRRFQQWFACYDNDVKKIRVNAEPKPEKPIGSQKGKHLAMKKIQMKR